MSQLERVYEGEIVESPWQYTETGRPIFVSNSYSEHCDEWIVKKQESARVNWEQAAIAYSLVGIAVREPKSEPLLRQFAGEVVVSVMQIRKHAAAYSLRTLLESEPGVEVALRFATLSESLTFKHFIVAHQKVLNPAETNALEAGEWLEKADIEGWSANELGRQIEASKPIPPWPDGVYRVIYADPPWEYDSSELEQYGTAKRHYPTMSTEKLCALDDDEREGFASRVRELAGDETVLFLWATSGTLPAAFEVIEAWGFVYKSSFVWDKVGHNYGHYNSVRHELLLVATKGSCMPDKDELYDSVVTVDKTSIHSQKPEVFREMIDDLYQWGPRIELFLRGEAPEGWEGWGLEAS